MKPRAKQIARALCKQGTQLVANCWMQPWPVPRAAARGLHVPLHPSPLARRAARLFVAAQLLGVLELAWIGHRSAAAVLLTFAAGCIAWCRVQGRGGPQKPRRLLLSADGRLHVLDGGGLLLQVRLHPASLCLGRWLLLRLQGAARTYLVLVGPDNLQAATLAALRRRLLAGRCDFD